MSKVILKKAIYSNFKGISKFELVPSEATTSIYGDNGVGKTTLRDGYLWCLTGRDSLNRFNHEIKPLDKDGKTIHNLESSVQLILEKDGKEYDIKRVFKEVWSRKTGDTEKTFDNNTTDFYINGVKTNTKTQFEKVVSEVFDLDLVQLLSDPAYFVGLKWQEQREMLFRLIEVTDKDVEALNKDLEGFSSKYNTSMLDVEKKSLNAKKREISKDIQDSEAKREENLNSLGEAKDWSAIEKAIKEKNIEVEAIDEQLSSEARLFKVKEEEANKEYFNKYNKLNKELLEAKAELAKRDNDARANYDKGLIDLANKLKIEESKRDNITDQNNLVTSNNKSLEEYLKELNETRNTLLEEYKEIKSRTLSVDPTCPTCGAIRGDIDTYKTQIEEQFNKRKADDLANNIAKGKDTAAKISEVKGKFKPNIDLSEVTASVAKIQNEIDLYPRYEEPKEVVYLKEKVEAISMALDELKPVSNTNIQNDTQSTLKSKKTALLDEIKILGAELYEKKVYEDKSARITELEKNIKSSNIAMAKLDGEIYLIDLFEKTKNELCENLINKKFEVVQFTLFEYLNDGTPKPNCQALFKGIPTSTLNTGGVINVGLDIIRTFSKHFSQSYPVFIDNKESVTKTIQIDSQVINLIVQEGQSKLLVK